MSEKMMRKSRVLLAALFGMVAIAALSIWGCGTDSYTAPSQTVVTTKTETALIQASDLQRWMAAGLVNRPGGYDRVVVLDVSNNDGDGTNKYNSVGHIPGAQLISAGSAAFMDNTRAEGPMTVVGSMVCTGATIDSIIQNAGIDGNTTIVLTNNAAGFVNVARAYTTFRYWGFPKERLKVLQGGNAAWVAGGYELTKAVPTVAKSTFGVAQNGTTRVNTDIRVSLPEMISYVKGIVAGNAGKVTLVDTVRGASKVSSTTDLLDGTKYTPMDGAIKGSYSYVATKMTTPDGSLTFKDAATIKSDLAAALGTDGTTAMGAANRDATKTFIAFCRAGNYASVGYFALDGIAYYNDPNVDVKWYDGSLGQWNLLVAKDRTVVDTDGVRGVVGAAVNVGGKLKIGSDWDTTALMDNLTFNVLRPISGTDPTLRTIVDISSRLYSVEPSLADGNQIETVDKAYRSTVSPASAGGSSSGGGGC